MPRPWSRDQENKTLNFSTCYTILVFNQWFDNYYYNYIDPIQKWLSLNYYFVHIQNSLTNLIWDNKFFTIFVSKYEQKNNNKAAIFA